MKAFLILSFYCLVEDVRGAANDVNITCAFSPGGLIEENLSYNASFTNPDCAIDKRLCLGCKDVRHFNRCRIDHFAHCKTEFDLVTELVVENASPDRNVDPNIMFPGPWVVDQYQCGLPHEVNQDDLNDDVSFAYTTVAESSIEDLSNWNSIDCHVQGRKFHCDGETIKMIEKPFKLVMLNPKTKQVIHEMTSDSAEELEACLFNYKRTIRARSIPTVFNYRAQYGLQWNSDCQISTESCLMPMLTMRQARKCMQDHPSCHVERALIFIREEETLPVETTVNFEGNIIPAYVPLVYMDAHLFDLIPTRYIHNVTIDQIGFGIDVGPADLYVSRVFGGPLEGKLASLNTTYPLVEVGVVANELGDSFVYLNKYVEETHKVKFSAVISMKLDNPPQP